SKLTNVLYDKSHKGKEFLRIMLEIGKEDTFNVCNEIMENIKIGDLNNTSSFNNGTSNDNVLENNYDNHVISHNYKFNSNKNFDDINNINNTDKNGINNTKNGSVENSINDSNISISDVSSKNEPKINIRSNDKERIEKLHDIFNYPNSEDINLNYENDSDKID
ncbi:hypothetical protein COBT_004267, partial [Conglomerata obtusa]